MGLHLHGEPFGGNVKRAIVVLALIAFSYANAQQIIDPQKIEGGGFRLGPYPVPIEQDEVKGVLYTWLFFNTVVEGRVDPVYKLYLTLKSQLNTLPPMILQIVRTTLPQNNCGRINAVDNWVYGMNMPTMKVMNENTVRIEANGSIETWSCFRNPVDETVCDHYTDSFGNEIPYNCRTRRGSPIKARNLQQGYEITKDIRFRSVNGEWRIRDDKATVFFTGDSVGTMALNTIAFIQNNLGAALGNPLLTEQRIKMTVPEEYRFLNPRYERAGFEMSDGVPFLVGGASISVSANQINDFMQKYFGSLWTPIAETNASRPGREPWTKARLRQYCKETAPELEIADCGARMGIPYDGIPD